MRASEQTSFVRGRGLLTLILAGAVAVSLASVDWGGGLIHSGGGASAARILSGLVSPEASPGFLKLAVEAAWTTVAYAVAGLTLAVAAGFPLGVAASGTLLSRGRARTASVAMARLLLAILRSAHELVWAWLFVVAIGLTPMAAVLALALPYAGVLGRLYADFLNDVPENPLRALRSAGASQLGVLAFGRVPMALPDMLSYTFYRFECGIRSAAILSFIGIQGIGYQIQLSLDELFYDQVWTLLFFLIALIAAVDVWSGQVRRSLTR